MVNFEAVFLELKGTKIKKRHWVDAFSVSNLIRLKQLN
jgi:hypothetical protein